MKVSGAVSYFCEHMAVGDYFTQEGEARMTWTGTGATKLGLTGTCQLSDFETLCAGVDPGTGKKLLVRDKGAHRRVCFFAQLSPPKDVSVLHLVAGDARIVGWWDQAVAETLSEMEDLVATRVRQRGQNSDRRTGSMLAAIVTHDANRALDPQLHTHVCLLNLTYDSAEERWKSVQPSALYRHQGYLREICYNRLAALMLAGGYRIETGGRIGFTVKGFPAELRERFSKRRRAILAEARESGVTTQDALQAITSRSRAAKQNATAAQLKAGWVREAADYLPVLHALIAGTRRAKKSTPPLDPTEALRSAEAHVFERKCVVDDRLLLREALIAGRGRVDPAGLRRALRRRESSGDLIRIDNELASREGLESEHEIIAFASARTKGNAVLGAFPGSAGLSPDQSEAVRGILVCRSGVIVLQGDAGTGKTTCLRAMVAGIEQSGGHVFACAPSSGAADLLRRELTCSADTLQQLLTNYTLQQTTAGHTVLVDEAGLVSVRQMRDLCRLAARNRNRLLLVGDTKQHTSIEAGDALRCLQEFAHAPVFHLTEIRRQRNPELRRAVAALARGSLYEAFKQFDRLGAVHEHAEQKLFHAAATDYVRTLQSGNSCLAISPVWEEIHAFSAAVRTLLRASGHLTTPDRRFAAVSSLKLTREEKRRPSTYRAGDVLTFHRDTPDFRKHDTATVLGTQNSCLLLQLPDGTRRSLDPRCACGFDVGTTSDLDLAIGDRLLIRANAKPAHLRNGDLVQVSSFSGDGSIHLTDGRTIPPWFRELTHGYATTSHAAQGKTVDRGILLLGPAGLAAANLKQAYVSCSRFRDSHAIYTTDKHAALETMMRPADRKLGLELTGGLPAPQRPWRARWRHFLDQAFGLKAA